MTVCKWCKKEVEIPFEETQDTRKRTYFKGTCPECGRINKRWGKPDALAISPAEEVLEEVPQDIPEDIPDQSQEEPIPDDSEDDEVIEPKEQELITEPEEKEEDKPTNWKDIALMALVAIVIIQIIILIWYTTKKKEDKHGQKTDQME